MTLQQVGSIMFTSSDGRKASSQASARSMKAAMPRWRRNVAWPMSPGAATPVFAAANRQVMGDGRRDPVALHQRDPGRSGRGDINDERRAERVARGIERLGRPLCPCRARHRARPRLGTRRSGGFEAARGVRPAIDVKASAVGLKGRSDVAVGAKVFHSKFGGGTVIAVDGDELEMEFEHAPRSGCSTARLVEVVG